MAIRWRPPVAAAIAVAPSVVVEIFFEYRFAGVMRTRRLDLLWHKILICESVGQVGIARIGKGKWNGNTEDKVTGTFFLQNKVKNPTAKRRLKKAHAATGAPSCVCVRKIWLSAAHRKPKRLDGSELPSLVAHLCCTCHSASLGRAPRARWDVGNKQYSGGGKRENGCDRSQTERPLKKPRVRRRRKGEERERRVYVQGKRERQREKGCRRRSLSSSRIRILRVSIFGGRVAKETSHAYAHLKCD
ncbi:hypothetical protein MUK42_11086 [Musa troglodytarum]|uniref:Uncharacterized protein n=1 Tax=Musa troglodytarum TaxID=320322 RepID=A0A9E7GVS2_9LILI|nr:hypothetical protein MUK42_11086 [Musa troglodytarum]